MKTAYQYNVALGKRLRAIRCDAKASRELFAEILTLSPYSYRSYEQGKMIIKAHHLYLIEKALNLPAGYIMAGMKGFYENQ